MIVSYIVTYIIIVEYIFWLIIDLLTEIHK